jgi:NAD(P)H-quinone oxidoreductase subunit 5
MQSAFLWLAALGPLGLAGLGIATLGRRLPSGDIARRAAVDGISRAAIGAALVALCIASATATFVAFGGPLHTPMIGVQGIGLSLYADALTAVIFLLVAFIGVIVVAYSRNYLEGDPGHVRFTGMLCLTLSAVLMVILSGNLFLFAAAWIATSLGLQRLLVFYPERPAAQLAARKEFIASRCGDICLVLACGLLYRMAGSCEYRQIFDAARALQEHGGALNNTHLIALLLVGTAVLKSAQFPLHGWLIEVMETPTPVSALLHAGIVNAGGFLILRFSDVIALSFPALNTLAIIGGFTALFGSVVMLTQTSIKVSLAYSTIAQMGFMMLECGLGAFSAALLHILAHSLYKAHAFLSSGSVIDIARGSWTPSALGKPHPWRLVIAIGVVLLVTLAVSQVFGATLTAKPGVFALGAVFVMSVIHMVASSIDERPNSYVIGRALLLSGGTACIYFGLQRGAELLMAGTLPRTLALRGPAGVAIVGVVVLSFATVVILQGVIPRREREPKWQALYAHVANGLYVNTLANRLVIQLWPSKPAKAATPIETAPGARAYS